MNGGTACQGGLGAKLDNVASPEIIDFLTLLTLLRYVISIDIDFLYRTNEDVTWLLAYRYSILMILYRRKSPFYLNLTKDRHKIAEAAGCRDLAEIIHRRNRID